MLDCNLLVVDMLKSEGHDMTFEVNGYVRSKFYEFTDIIYSPWSYFVHPIHVQQREMKGHFIKI